MNRSVICASVILACTVVISGCSAPGTTGSESKSEQRTSETPAQPSPSPEPVDPRTSETPAQPSPSPEPVDPRTVLADCPSRSYAEGEKVIMQQIKEFNSGRFKAARKYASVQFREAVTLQDFRRIIKDNYPFLLESSDISISGCIERDEALYFQVAVTSRKVTVLTYRLVRDQGGLAVDAASIIARSVEAEV